MTTVQWRPVDGGDWQELGTAFGSFTFSGDDTDAELVMPPTSTQTQTITFTPHDPTPAPLIPETTPPVSMMFTSRDTVPDLPEPPRRRRWLQGKRYRIARRRYGRTVRAWRRAGSPTIELDTRIYLPNVEIVYAEGLAAHRPPGLVGVSVHGTVRS
jgi:hypothetical protein